MTCLGSAGAGKICACGVLSLSILRPRGVSHRAPVLGAPCYVALFVGKVLVGLMLVAVCFAALVLVGVRMGATCLIFVESGVGLGGYDGWEQGWLL